MDDKRLTEKSFDELGSVRMKKFLKEYYMVVIVFVLMIFSAMVVVYPFIKEIFSLRNEISSAKKDLAILQEKESLLESLDDYKLNSQVSLLESALPSEKPALQIIDILNASSEVFGLNLGVFEFSPGSLATESSTLTKTSKGINSIKVEVDVSGDFDELLSYIDQMESALPMMKANSIGFSSSRGQSVDATLELDVYYLLPPETIGKTSDPLREISDESWDTYDEIESYTKMTADLTPAGNYPERENPFEY